MLLFPTLNVAIPSGHVYRLGIFSAERYKHFTLFTVFIYAWPEVLMEGVSLPLGRGMTVYSSPPPYPAQGLGTVVVVVLDVF